jgi:hypothetical protein
MRKALLLMTLAVMVASFTGCSSDDAIDLAGTWSMVANQTFQFDLTIKQDGSTITGTMVRVAGTEADTPIAGTIDGTTVSFTRTGATFTQVYTGSITPDAKTMGGTFTAGGGTTSFPWNATR